MEREQSYRHEVARLIAQRLKGTLHEDPLVLVERVVDVTTPGVVLRLKVHTQTVHAFGQERVYTFQEWEDYTDKSPESMAAGLAVQIWSDLVDVAATGEL